MFEPLLNIAWVIWALPMLAALAIAIGYLAGPNRGERGERFTTVIAMSAMFGSITIIVALDIYSLIHGTPGLLVFGEWMHSGQYQISISMFIDAFGLVMLNLVALINLFAMRFSINYLHREPGFQRFFIILSLFTTAMLLLISAGNLVLMFAGWELAGICSYLLIAYAYDRRTATENASVAIISNRIGDAAFLLGIFLTLYWLQSSSWGIIYDQASQLPPFASLSIGASLLIAAFVKSGQLPFSGWLVRALEGPTSSSAIFYGAVMVHSGVYLILRLEPILIQVPLLMYLLIFVGLCSTIYGFLVGLVQTDIKSRLIFSTISQIGLMLIGCGLGWFEFTRWYLPAHAAWRAYQFLHAPSAMHMVSRRAKPMGLWLRKHSSIYHAAIERFWLEPISQSLLIKPTQSFARDLDSFDERIITRMVGLPNQINAISTSGNTGQSQQVKGVLGRFMDSIASQLHWFEEHLILKGGSTGLQSFIANLGHYLEKVESLLSHPRYLILMVAITYVVIL